MQFEALPTQFHAQPQMADKGTWEIVSQSHYESVSSFVNMLRLL